MYIGSFRIYFRRDRYEKHVKLYWTEKRIAGRLLPLDCIDPSRGGWLHGAR